MSIFKKLFEELPVDYKLGYQDGFNGCLKFMKETLKMMGKLDVEKFRAHQNKSEPESQSGKKE